MQKTQSDVSIDAIASVFRSGFAEMASISFCLESAIASGFRVGFAEMAGISSRGGHVRAFTYDYVKTRPEHPAPHDLSATQSEAPRPECVVIDIAKCGFRSGIGERAGISTYWENMAACCLRVGFAEMGGISSRGGHVRAFTYDYVKSHPEHLAPHDLSASQSEAPQSECVVIDVPKCGFQSGIAEMAGDFQADTTYSVAKKLWLC